MLTEDRPATPVSAEAVSLTTVPAARPRGRLHWVIVAVIFVSCALFLDLSAVVEAFRRVPSQWILIIFVLMTIDRLLMAWKWSVLLEALQVKIRFGSLVRFYYQGNLAGILLPSGIGGDLLRAHWVSGKTDATHRVYASLIMEKVIGFVSAANWALIGTAVLLFEVANVAASWAGVVVASVILLNGLFLLSLQPRVHDVILQWFEAVSQFRLLEFLQRVYKAYRQYGKQRRALVWNGLLTVCEHGLQMVVVLTMARSLGFQQYILPFLAITAVYLLVYRLPISPDGWGVGEATSIVLYSFIGVSPENAFGLAFFAHVMQTLIVLPGLWFFWRSEPIPRL